MPRVSVNLCCHNSAAFLEATLQSVFAQTYTDWELVIVNDASQDATEAIIQRHLAEGRRIVYHATPENVGLGAARNLALERSSGELIAFIDHDDLWMPHKLERQLPCFDHARVGLVYTDCLNVWETGYQFRQFEKLRPCAGDAFHALLVQYPVSIQTTMIHRRVLRDGAECFDARFRVLEDLDFVLRVARRWHVAFVDEPLVRVMMRHASATRTHRDRFPIEMRLILQKQRDEIPDFDQAFASEAARFTFGIARAEARIAWAQGRRRDAMAHLRAYRWRYLNAFRDLWLIRCMSYAAYQQARVSWSRGARTLRLTRSLGCPSLR